jgi:predicted Fe-Mo cluster-binding NifX family protein
MKIAVTSQNRREITSHAGKCRKFWIYQIDEQKQVQDKQLLELPLEQSFHNSPANQPHPLDGIDVLISQGMGNGMLNRLQRMNAEAVMTLEKQPDVAVEQFLAGTLQRLSPDEIEHHHHH